MDAAMRQALIEATEMAILEVDNARFFATERGFHGRFYCALQAQLDRMGITGDRVILEMEYQKSRRHATSQRPDIILHVPAELSGMAVTENNYAVWALKRRATIRDARSDFALLEEMFEALNYPLGFFVNIASLNLMLEHYAGAYQDRLRLVAAAYQNGKTIVRAGDP